MWIQCGLERLFICVVAPVIFRYLSVTSWYTEGRKMAWLKSSDVIRPDVTASHITKVSSLSFCIISLRLAPDFLLPRRANGFCRLPSDVALSGGISQNLCLLFVFPLTSRILLCRNGPTRFRHEPTIYSIIANFISLPSTWGSLMLMLFSSLEINNAYHSGRQV